MTDAPKPKPFAQAEQRLIDYGIFCRHPIVLRNGIRCTLGRVVEMGENAGIFGDGANYETFLLDGESVSVRPDGGMGELMATQQSELRAAIRAKETHDAVRGLRAPLQRLVVVTWVDLPPGVQSLPSRRAAEALGMNQTDYRAWRMAVLGIVDARLCLPHFEVLEDFADERSQAA